MRDSTPIAEALQTQTKKIPHYYGDEVRGLLIAIAVISTIAIPIWKNFLPVSIAIQVGIIVILVILAGLTSPDKRWTMTLDAGAAAVGVTAFEATAVIYYQDSSMILFLVREVVALLFLSALYFSIKTLRGMATKI